ncbi:hypothetical protein [Limnochorda pilosa]|uniref:Uncharacterized protein n=1 Tax=Limnochorda pilosa TaxID=1555112 RepID=A0A0K2SN23_LIMPI|nr:hypothetical protein [Limnochorda pilosa]BAS28402.1 hypothetical protein LIP_2572 [Limnochorda pilosa]
MEAWEVGGTATRLLELAAAGPAGSDGWRLDADAVLQLAGSEGEGRPVPAVQEGRMVLDGPPLRLQLLVDRPHLSSADPMALISGSRRGEGQPGLTVEAAGTRWDLSTQVVRRIDNPGPDGDMASLRVRRWWGAAHGALTFFRLQQGMLPWPDGDREAAGGGGALLQQLVALEGYLPAGEAEVGAEVALAQPAGASTAEPGQPQEAWAGLLRLRTLPWRPSAPLRLEAGLFQTDPGFRSLAAREEAFPAGAAGGWAEAHLTFPGRRRLDVELCHARPAQGGAEARAQVEGRTGLAGLTWTAGIDALSRRTAGEEEAWVRGRLAIRRAGAWEVEASGGARPARLTVLVRLPGGAELRAGADASDGGTYRLELRRVAAGASWRLVWKARSERAPDRHLFLEAEPSLAAGSFLRVRVGRWDRGRYDAVWGWPERMEVALGRRF